ncbi:ubiquitin carboxyl-terminal hydrolase 16-like [Rhincodon typus]|uniref:ubiquitin carboxyl-terminal hydrolase 16-like n=1 Tax=Rhincodon typus TaxID=259920 RepID=UPI00202FD5BB|nr:ubiquitin carboxyl-terminal hydrolase 16-like [Rhincodon typus]
MMENEESKKTMKAYEKEGSMLNFVDRVFGGTMTSTIMCEECKMVTLVEESFLDLSLPVLDEQIDKKKSLGKSGRNIIDGDQNDNRGDCDGNFISKNRDDVSTGTSKYQQKKAKKQAKKQAKRCDRRENGLFRTRCCRLRCLAFSVHQAAGFFSGGLQHRAHSPKTQQQLH